MFIEIIGMNSFSFLATLISTLGVFAIGLTKEEEEENEKKVVFKDQDAFNEVVESRLAKQKKKILDEQEQKLKDMKEDFEHKMSDLKDDLKEAKKVKSNEKDDDNPKLDELTKTVETLNKEIKKITKEKTEAVENVEKVKTANREKTIQSTIVSLLSEARVTAPNDIYLILKESGNIILDDDGKVVPVYENTENQVVSGSGDPMDIKTFIDGWLKERPHFVSASGNKGSGTKSAETSKLKPGEINDGESEDKPMTLAEILKSPAHKEKEKEVRESSSLQHGGIDLE